MTKTIAATVAAAALALPASAAAHITLQPNEAPAGGYARLDVRVPNERDNADTTKVDLKLPHGFASASYEPVPGWTVKVTKEKLAKPVQTDDGEVTEEVSRITWSGGAIKPGEFQDFGLSVALPDKAPGTKLTFKAVQTYSNGDVVRWIGPPDADEPAPQVTLTAGGDDHHATEKAADTRPAAATTAGNDDDSGAPVWLAVVALVLGAAGLAAGAVALLGGRRRSA